MPKQTKRRRPASKTRKPLSIQMSTQATMFLESLAPDVRDGFLGVIEKLASGKLVGKRVNMSELSPEDRRIIEASSREMMGRKPIRA